MRRPPALLALLLLAPLLSGCPATPAGGAPPSRPVTTPHVASAEPDTLSYGTFRSRAADPGTVLLDVRTPQEYASGHIPSARNADLRGSFEASLGAYPRNGHYLVYDRTGKRSEEAVARMRAMGFTDVHDLDGGVVAWEFAGYPLVEGAAPGERDLSIPSKPPTHVTTQPEDRRGPDGRFHPDETPQPQPTAHPGRSTAPAAPEQPRRDDLPGSGR